jgi:hypothetical protein
MQEMFDTLLEYLPFLIPLIVISVGLTIAALVHIFKHETYKTGNRTLWVFVCLLFSFFGPILYFIIGRSEE